MIEINRKRNWNRKTKSIKQISKKAGCLKTGLHWKPLARESFTIFIKGRQYFHTAEFHLHIDKLEIKIEFGQIDFLQIFEQLRIEIKT